MPALADVQTVYPRACGGTRAPVSVSVSVLGLSPRVRGNPPAHSRADHGYWSIPARAGEPISPMRLISGRTVYPRACGGTLPSALRKDRPTGLSPRVRGNHLTIAPDLVDAGSIPARAGEPRAGNRAASARTVYPRACGGTNPPPASHFQSNGLSPRVRGNLVSPLQQMQGRGSIPARAGEPITVESPFVALRVYPRACGGTARTGPGQTYVAGLSPRVRGNPQVQPVHDAVARSIPARAGEPVPPVHPTTCTTVYPRACGGTGRKRQPPANRSGLSPRVRGNPSP